MERIFVDQTQLTHINLSRSCLYEYEYDSSTIVNIIEKVNVASYILYLGGLYRSLLSNLLTSG